ncbi:methyltransferase domain-containing protein [Actinoplanes couchii]|uniref:Carboxy-S-adenosyl-L-methionine synthase n=1 Tax=Actinoplanes couchii TaxID=403638 RepID=A0ABQ3XSI8_9ACTN|nr:methyltransferase domain-containing protein [Actinoplanes couchii]MDR6315922.1 tRNA (cmo5U34)-methyltransferase [Actinoplanes couchii]GID61428.1 carboxy-S-adenosyl-L-methionine synthase [Actinoplanes couchii]
MTTGAEQDLTAVGDGIHALNAAWSFAGESSVNFDDHVSKSVPFYQAGHDLVEKLSDFFVGPASTVYDLGCSTGALTERLARRHQGRDVRMVGVDREPDMVGLARDRCGGLPGVEIVQADLRDMKWEKADLIVMYYAMQFVPPRWRQEVLDQIYEALNWGGALIIFEKVRGPDARFQDVMTQLYTEYKLSQGYTPDDIVAKSRSLKNVLEPFSTRGNIDLLSRAGFVDYMTVQKYVCFEGFLAIK